MRSKDIKVKQKPNKDNNCHQIDAMVYCGRSGDIYVERFNKITRFISKDCDGNIEADFLIRNEHLDLLYKKLKTV